MNSVNKIYKWFKEVDGHTLKIETENKAFEIPLSSSSIAHLLGLQYIDDLVAKKLQGIKLLEYVMNKYSNDDEIFSSIPRKDYKKVFLRLFTFKDFLKNLEKGFVVQNTHPKTDIRSEDFIIEIENGKYLHLGLLSMNGVGNFESFGVLSEDRIKILQTYFQNNKDKYFSQSPYQEKIKSIEIRKPQQEQFVPFSFKELKEIDEQSHTIEVAKKKATFSLQQILEKKKEEIKQEDAAKTSPFRRKGEVER